MVDRDALLKELSRYRCVPGHGPDLSKLSNQELKLRLKLLKSMLEEAFKDAEKGRDERE